MFFKINLLFNFKRLIKHQFIFLFGYPSKNLGFTPFYKYAYSNSPIFEYLIKLETSLSIILIRLKFYPTVYNSVSKIKTKQISVNGNIIIDPKFHLKELDLIQKCRLKFARKKRLRLKKHVWR